MSNPLILTNTEGGITGFNVFNTSPYEFYSLVDDSIATRLEPIPLINVLLTEQTLNEKRNLPCFWKQNKIEKDQLTNFSVKLPKISKEEWVSLVLFFEHWAKDGLANQTLEVGTFIMFDEEENRVFFIVPEQTVSSVSVEWSNLSNKKASTLDGLVIQSVSDWNSQYKFIGYCHSHNTMTLDTPSSIDDSQEVLDRPFGLHLLLSTFSWLNDEVSYKVTFTAGIDDTRVFLDADLVVPEISLGDLSKGRVENDFTELNKFVTIYVPPVYKKGKWDAHTFFKNNTPAVANPDRVMRFVNGAWEYRDAGQLWNADDVWDLEYGQDVYQQTEYYSDSDFLPGTIVELNNSQTDNKFDEKISQYKPYIQSEFKILEETIENLYLLGVEKEEVHKLTTDVWDFQVKLGQNNTSN